MNTLSTFLELHHLKFLTIHILGVVLGLGGATISDLLFFKFLKDFRISKKEQEVLQLLKNLILGALFIIILTGVAIYLPNSEAYNQSPAFLMKVTAVVILTLNGIALHLFIAPYLLHFNLKNHQKMGRMWHKLAFALGAISAVSWYSVFLIAMLKSDLPPSFMWLLGLYSAILALGIGVSQYFETRFCKEANQAKN